LAVIKNAHLTSDPVLGLVFETYISEHTAAQQFIPIIEPAAQLLLTFLGPKPESMNGKAVWVETTGNIIKYLEPFKV